MTARRTNWSAIDSLLLRIPSVLVTRTVRGLEATVIRSSKSQEPMPTFVNSAKSIVVTTAENSRIALTTAMPAMSAVLLQLFFSIAGAQSFRNRRLSRQVVGDLRAW